MSRGYDGKTSPLQASVSDRLKFHHRMNLPRGCPVPKAQRPARGSVERHLYKEHRGLPQNHAKFEHNVIADNNADYYGYVRDGRCSKPSIQRGYESGVVCPPSQPARVSSTPVVIGTSGRTTGCMAITTRVSFLRGRPASFVTR
jgi:hypothetical protein